jgi:hypothetical protein
MRSLALPERRDGSGIDVFSDVSILLSKARDALNVEPAENDDRCGCRCAQEDSQQRRSA